jgi:hypothetical protein
MYDPNKTVKKGGIAAVIVGAATLVATVICNATGTPEDMKPQVTGLLTTIFSGGIFAIINAVKNRNKKTVQ